MNDVEVGNLGFCNCTLAVLGDGGNMNEFDTVQGMAGWREREKRREREREEKRLNLSHDALYKV